MSISLTARPSVAGVRPKPMPVSMEMGSPIVIGDRPELVQLLVAGHETAQLAEIVIFLRRDRPFVVELIIQPGRGHEFQAGDAALVGIVHDGIEGEAQAVAETPADDGANFAGIDLAVPLPLVPAEFEIHAVIEILVFVIGLHEQRPQLEPVIGRALAVGDRNKAAGRGPPRTRASRRRPIPARCYRRDCRSDRRENPAS